MVTVTPKAVQKIREAFAREGVAGGLRLGVLGGGCSGLSYQFKFDPRPRATDQVMKFDDDVQVFIESEAAAHAYLAVELTSLDRESGHATVDARDASVSLAKVNGEWVITAAESKEMPAVR